MAKRVLSVEMANATSLSSCHIRGQLAFGATFASHARRLVPGRPGWATYGVLDGHEVLSVTNTAPVGSKEMPRTSFAVHLVPALFLGLLVNPRGATDVLRPFTSKVVLPGLMTHERAFDEMFYVTAMEEERALALLSPQLRTALFAAVGHADVFAMNDTMLGLTFDGLGFPEHTEAPARVRTLLALPAVHALLGIEGAEVSISDSHVFVRLPGLDPAAPVELVSAAARALLGMETAAADGPRPFR